LVAKKAAQKICRNGPGAIKRLKRVVRDGLDMSFDDASKFESEEFSALFELDGIEGMKAFVEKRKPNW